jgi:hypothetical protein
MTKSSVGTYVHEPFYIHGNITSEVALDVKLTGYDIPKTGDFLIGEVVSTCIRIYTRLGHNLLAC